MQFRYLFGALALGTLVIVSITPEPAQGCHWFGMGHGGSRGGYGYGYAAPGYYAPPAYSVAPGPTYVSPGPYYTPGPAVAPGVAPGPRPRPTRSMPRTTRSSRQH
jgi:hypothetical protein